MTVWFVAAVPLLIMFFALAMERLENRLRSLAVPEPEIAELRQVTKDKEMRALLGDGRQRDRRHTEPAPERSSPITPPRGTALDSTDVIGGAR